MRKEQKEAVSMTIDFAQNNPGGEFLWNAKPRFGKTLAVYDLCTRIKAHNVLIVTNRPAIANSWYDDYVKFMGQKSGYLFVSDVDSLKNRTYVSSKTDFIYSIKEQSTYNHLVFLSLQDLKGSSYFSTSGIDKLREIADTFWDLLVIDEAHEGVDTFKTDIAFERIRRNFTLHLSGTPFKALANNKFKENAIYNWTYADEQQAKLNWDDSAEMENPYLVMPKLNLFTYQMSEIIKEEISQGIEIQGETEEYAFDLNEFFSTTSSGFKYDSSVDRFLNALTTQKKFPFSAPELINELKHTLWLLDRVDSARALALKLQKHPVFSQYEIILAAGDGKLENDQKNSKSYDKVVKAIKDHDKTITLSVGQLTTGITIPEWTAVLMLSNVKSPALYMQTAFRAQNPCMFSNGNGFVRKENAYIFDFDPARTLTIFEAFANDLSTTTVNQNLDTETRQHNIKKLLNFFPVIGEDENGELIELDAEKVLSIPRKIRSTEVVKRGFMSNFLFQNISNVFGAPSEILEIITSFEQIKEPKRNSTNLSQEISELPLDESGNANVSEDIVIGQSREIFGDKIFSYEDFDVETEDITTSYQDNKKTQQMLTRLKNKLHDNLTEKLLNQAQQKYEHNQENSEKKLRTSEKKKLKNKINAAIDEMVDKSVTNYEIERKITEQKRSEAIQNQTESGRTQAEIEQEFNEQLTELDNSLKQDIQSGLDQICDNAVHDIVRTVETSHLEQKKNVIENTIRDHLRGFSRTIPSFLMAYGHDAVTLATFDTIIPDNVFKDVTGISLDQFRFLRDGGQYTDHETGKTKEFSGQLFDPIVFDDSIKAFMELKKKLANYFDKSNEEDIFDYIPAQKTNQIFTPKKVVKHMVDLLEQENPGCFDSPEKTFIDLYMKSGLYIAEVVKRLYQSSAMEQHYPVPEERLKHIFEKQVYGLAPTEIIHKIATNFILGFDTNGIITHHNFKQLDALPYVQEGTLPQKLDEIYGK